MFDPQYVISHTLLQQIKKIYGLVAELNEIQLPQVVLFNYEKSAREVSTYASTSIEGNPLPLTEVKRVLKTAPVHLRDSEREVINYNDALLQLQLENKTPLTASLIQSIHYRVVKGLLSRSDSGKWRKKPVVVNDPRSGQVVYLPPDIVDVPQLMTDLIQFGKKNQTKIDPVILAGLFHKQMVIIHPFMDGNGRTTRLITKHLLAQMGLDTFHLFSFERYYNNNVTRYFQMVGEYGNYYDLAHKIDFTSWLEYFADGIVDELMRVQKTLDQIPTTPSVRLERHHQLLLSLITKNGSVTDREYAAHTQRSKASRTLDFQKLVEWHLIQRVGGGRSTYYVMA